MQTWTQLSRLALIGTEQQAPAPVASGDPDLDGAFAKLGSNEQRELYALSAGAALTLARRAGHKPGLTTHAVSPAPSETQPRCPETAGQALARMLGDYLPQVLPEWLELAGTHGLRAPEELLPELLDQAGTKHALRPLVKRVLGQRGAWLAAQNPDWSFAIRVNDSEKAWQEGKRIERVSALNEIRQSDPTRAREWLMATWKDEPPEDRADFIQVLSTRLSLEDEPFLETALDDKRKEVRTAAVRLLASLPESKLVRRMTELAMPLLQAKKQLLRGVSLEVTLPSECTKEMTRYGVESKSPDKEIGEKAWWLKEILELVPPAHWAQTFKLSPKELIAAAQKSEWAKVIFLSWALAISRHQDREWTQAWLEAAVAKEDLLDAFPPATIQSFSAAELEAPILRLLPLGLFQHNRVTLLLGVMPEWTEKLSRQIVSAAQRELSTISPADYSARARWQSFLKTAATRVAITVGEATSGWPKNIEQNPLREAVDEFCAVIEFRRAIHRHFKGES